MVGFILKVLYGQIEYVVSYYRFMFIRAVCTFSKEALVKIKIQKTLGLKVNKRFLGSSKSFTTLREGYVLGRVPLHIRFFSTKKASIIKRSVRPSAEFWCQVNTKKKRNEMNPHYLVESFIQSYPNRELAKANLNYELIVSILSLHVPNFHLTLEEFNLLKSIQPVRFELPFVESPEIIGKPLREGKGIKGVYVFTNKLNGYRYVGSSINLALRLKDGYFGNLPAVGKRKIEVAIIKYGLANFYHDVFLIPTLFEGSNKDIQKYHNLVLSLEQMLIMEINPEFNEIKVAGSNPGYLKDKNIKKSYLYDNLNKELIYIANGRKNLAKILACHEGVIKRYLAYKNKLYLNRFFIADEMLSEPKYSVNLKSLESLEEYLQEIRLRRKDYLTKTVPSREETNLKLSKPVELTNLVTGEVFNFSSLRKVTEYVSKYDLNFRHVTKATISRNVRTGVPYRKIFKFRYIG